MKKLLSLFIAVVMVFSMFPPTVRALTQDDTNSFAVSNASVEVDGTEDKVVEIKFYGTSSDTYATISGTFGKSDATNKIVLSGLNAGYTVDDFRSYADVTTGAFKLSQPADGATFDAEAPIVTATYTVPKDTPVGEYKVSVYVETSENFNGDYLDDATYAATIKVTSGGGNTPTTGDYAIWYELDSTAADTDSDNYKEYATGADVTATVKIQNNTNKAVVLQAYDIYLSYNANLLYQSTNLTSGVAYKTTNGVDAVAAANDVITHIQAVGSDAEKPIEIPMEAGATVELGTITFKIADAAVYGTNMPITLTIGTNNKTYTNIGVGTDVAVGGGDKVSYYPTNGGTHLGAEVNTTYTVLWKNDDGSTLETDTVGHNVMPEYNGDTPTKAADDQYTYTFDKWSPTVAAATRAATYTATYTTTTNSYTITWNNWDNTLLTTTTVAYGETPSYTGTTPTKAEDNKYTYTHSGWNPTISSVTGEATYTATFTANPKEFTITLNANEGTLPEGATETITYTAAGGVTLPTPTLAGKNFGGWQPTETVAADSWSAENTYTGEVPANMYGNVELKAVWNNKDYEVTSETGLTGGTVNAANADNVSGIRANAGDTINVTVTHDAGYEVGTVSYYKTDDETKALTTIPATNGTYSFTMPAYNVTVTATFNKVLLDINKDTVTNGSVTVKNAEGTTEITQAKPGDIVTLVANPDPGYKLGSYTVSYTDGDSNPQTVTVNEDGTFEMPAYEVTVKAEFVKADLAITITENTLGTVVAQNANNETITAAQFDNTVKLVASPEDGYKVTGYTVKYNDGTEDTPVEVTFDATTGGGSFTMPKYPVTVETTIVAETYTLKLDADGGTITAEGFTVAEGDPADVYSKDYTTLDTWELPTPTKANYTFGGWKLDTTTEGWPNGTYDGENTTEKTKVTGKWGNVTLTAVWKEAITYKVEDYKYAADGYKMLRIQYKQTDANETLNYLFDGASMFYLNSTDGEKYLVNSGDDGVFYTLIPVAAADGTVYVDSNNELTEDGMAKITTNTADRADIDYESGDINGDNVTNIADANIVYQMIVNGGKYYTDLAADGQTDIESRLMADMHKEVHDSSVARGTIEDVHAIVNIINGTTTPTT